MDFQDTAIRIPHSRPTLGPEERRAVDEVLRSGQVAMGPEVAAFEREMARAVGVEHAVATGSGTAALAFALAGLSAGPGTEVIVPAYVCPAVANAVLWAGATPVPADVDPETGCMDMEDAMARKTDKTRAVVAVHLFGRPVDPAAYKALSVPVVEDCAQAVGAVVNNRPVGSLSHAAVFSFYATKMLCTGEGGMVLTPDETVARKARAMRESDVPPSPEGRYNAKMTDVAAAMGRAQLRKLPGFVEARRRLAHDFGRAFSGLDAAILPDAPGHVFYRFVLKVPGDADEAVARIQARGASAELPVPEPLHMALGLPDYPGARSCRKHFVSIPIYPSLSRRETKAVVKAVKEALG
ncbi:MAG: DegT/DnrJ/EryC1/StrS family aminotransferase [Deltaproteobacteria bacterium]|nr:DegT/DnrJ/EryC1/StrS family aminotransferase [Deltaproteobacteria bacterium]